MESASIVVPSAPPAPTTKWTPLGTFDPEADNPNPDPPPQIPLTGTDGKEDARSRCCIRCAKYVLILFFFIASCTTIVIGILYYSKCPANKNLPLFVIAQGLFAFIVTHIACCICVTDCGCDEAASWLWKYLKNIGKTGKKYSALAAIVLPAMGVVAVILSTLWIAIAVGVFTTTTDFNSTDSPVYCHSVLYLWSFTLGIVAVVTVTLSFMIIAGIFVRNLICRQASRMDRRFAVDL